MTEIRSDVQNFSKLFYSGRFSVPWHQRRYDWEPDNVSELLQDIKEALEADRSSYFLGSIMLVESDTAHWEINDGQQRMVTFSLICARLCRLFQEEGESMHENKALRVLFDIDGNATDRLADVGRRTPRLEPPCDDKTGFTQMIRGNNIGEDGKLTKAWKTIDKFVAGMSKGGGGGSSLSSY